MKKMRKTITFYKCLVVVLSILCLWSVFQTKEALKLADETSKVAEKAISECGEAQKLAKRLSKEVEALKSFNFTQEEVILLAKCVQTEAGVNNHESQKYITQVIMNRVYSPSFPDSIHDVIYQKSGRVPQFSVAYNGMLESCDLSTGTLNNVYQVLLNGTDLPRYVQYFYSEKVTNNWVNTLNVYCVVEGTVFAYSSKEDV